MGKGNPEPGRQVSPEELWLRQRFLALNCLVLLVVIPAGAVIGWTAMRAYFSDPGLLSVIGALWLVVLAVFLWNRRGFRRVNALLLILLQNALPLVIVGVTAKPGASVGAVLYIAFAVVTASFLVSPLAGPILALLNVGALLLLHRGQVGAGVADFETVRLLTSRGVVLLVLLGATSWFFSNGVQRLLTDRVRVSTESKRRAAQQATLAALSQLASTVQGQEETTAIASRVVLTAAELLEMEGGFLLTLGPAEHGAVVRACSGCEGTLSLGQHLACLPGSFVELLAGRSELAAIDFDAPGAPKEPWLGSLNARCALLIGLPHAGATRGLLGVFRRTTPAPEREAEAGELLKSLASVFSAVEARQEDERRIRDSEGRYADLFHQSPDAIAVLDADGKVRQVNRAVEEITGYVAEELVGRRFQDLDLLPARERPRVLGLFAQLLAGGQGPPTEITLTHRDGSSRLVEERPRLIRRLDGSIEVKVVMRDITGRRKLEHQLREAHRLDAIGRLAGGLAHEYNNLLTVILASASILQSGDLDPGARGDVEQISNAARRGAELTHQLLAFGRQQVLEPRVIDLNQIVQGLLQILDRVVGEDISLAFVPGKELEHVRADPGQVQQSIIRLVAHARQAMPDGGELLIETCNAVFDVSPPGHEEIAVGRYVRLRISDTGTGMDEAEMARIFEPFLEAESTEVSLEMRLATVHGIVGQSHGHIWVESEVGKGTVFHVLLPVASATPQPEDDAAPPGGPSGAFPILLVEDDEAVRIAARRILERGGFEVLEATRAEEALSIAKTADRIPLLITDAILPGMRGRELAQRLREDRPEMKVLLISGYADGEVTGETDRSWRDGFLAKPFTPDQLLEKVRRLYRGSGSGAGSAS